MMSREEGKLLAGAAGFLFTLRERVGAGPIVFLRRVSFVMQKETLRIVRRYLHSASLPSG
jgi:hypothetical protein